MTRALGGPRRRLILLFSAVPVVLFGLPAAFGVPWLVGDNLIQNYPLRVLVGTDLRHGHLPLWDPLLWSGTPLLAGFNAGAAYPTTALFAILPATAAWAGNQVVLEIVAATGVLALLRVLGRSWLAAGLAAGAFTYGGFMAAQSVHIDVVQAGAWLPWAFVALDRLAHRPEGRPLTPWVALLGASLGLMALSGATEPILDGGVALVVVTLWLLWKTPGARRWQVAFGAAAGAGLGLLLSAAQTLPGAELQARSQRAVASYGFFASGSMNKSLSVLGIDPTVLGGMHSFPMNYFATYNLPEVSSYVGIMALMAVCGLLARRHWRSPDASQWRIWYLVLVVGLVLAWGHFTPLGHLEFHLPLYDRQRLLARNLLEVDLAAAVLFGVWVDRMFGPAIAAARSAPGPAATVVAAPGPADDAAAVPPPRWRVPGPKGWTSDVVLPLVPVAAALLLQVVLLAGGTWFPHLLHVPGQVTHTGMLRLGAYLVVPNAIAVAAGWLVVRRRRLGRHLPALLTVVLVADLALFNVMIQGFPSPHTAANPSNAWANALAAKVAQAGSGPAGGPHRMAVYDPGRLHPLEVNQVGAPDLNVLRDLASVQGYGALADGRYDAATGTHHQGNLDQSALDDDTFDRLDLGVLATVPEAFVHLVAAPTSRSTRSTRLPPVSPDAGAAPDLRPAPPTPTRVFRHAPPPSATSVVVPGTTATRFLGTVLSVTAVEVPVVSGPRSQVRVGLLGRDGRVARWLTATTASRIGGTAGEVVATAPRPVTAVGVVLRASARTTVAAPVVRTAGQGTYRLDGSLATAVSGPRWRYDGRVGIFPVFTTAGAAGRAWLAPDQAGAAHGTPRPGTTTAPGAAGTVRVVSAQPWGTETLRVSAPRAEVMVRSVAYDPGWRATVTSATSPAGVAATVHRAGVLQAVAVPAGTSTVTFTYRPRSVTEGLVLSGLGVVAVAGLLAWPLRRRRPRRRAPTQDRLSEATPSSPSPAAARASS